MVPDQEGVRRRVALWLALVLLALPMAGCALDDYVRQDGLWPAWLLFPFLLTLVLVSVIVGLTHSARLDRWDLRDSVGDPGVGRGLLLGYAVMAVLVCVSVTIYSFMVEAVDPMQRLYNIICWWLGGTLGSIAGWLLGMWFAIWKHKRA